MSAKRPFLPNNKPRLLVVAMLSGTVAIASVLGVFLFSALVSIVPLIAGACALLLMAIAAIAMPVCAISYTAWWLRKVAGCYRNMSSKPWREQVW